MCCKDISRTQSTIQFPKINTQSTTILSSPNLNFKTHVPNTQILTGSTRTQTEFIVKNNMYTATKSADTFYDVLGVLVSSGQSEIKRAYKQLARKFHPDVSPPGKTEEYTKKFIQVQEAYKTLSDPKTRVLYDMHMSKGLHLAFSAKKGDMNGEKPSQSMNHWQSQINELNWKSMVKNSRGANNVFRGDRMRNQGNMFE